MSISSKIGVYAGSFDPFTNGHLDIAQRASSLLETVIIAIGVNPAKEGFFTLEQRISIIQDSCKHLPNVHVQTFSGLLVHFCQQNNAGVIVRGLRNSQDYEFEATLGRANRKLANDIETILLVSNTESIYVSSSLIREIVLNGGDVEGLVSPLTINLFQQKLNGMKT